MLYAKEDNSNNINNTKRFTQLYSTIFSFIHILLNIIPDAQFAGTPTEK